MRAVLVCVFPGGFFIGCVPDGKRVKAHLAKSGGLLEQPHLRLKAISKVSLTAQHVAQARPCATFLPRSLTGQKDCQPGEGQPAWACPSCH